MCGNCYVCFHKFIKGIILYLLLYHNEHIIIYLSVRQSIDLSKSYNNAIQNTDVFVMKYYIVINCHEYMLKKKQDNLSITASQYIPFKYKTDSRIYLKIYVYSSYKGGMMLTNTTHGTCVFSGFSKGTTLPIFRWW